MKHFKTFALLSAAALLLCAVPERSALKVSAADPVQYLVSYDESDGQWKYRANGISWDSAEPQEHWELPYLMNGLFKDGDIIVIEGAAPYENRLDLNLSQYRISNLTLTHKADGIMVAAGGIDEFHALDESVASISGPIKNAFLYDYARVTFNNDIDTLQIIGTGLSQLHATATCRGTVGHVIGKDSVGVYYEYYDVAAGKLVIGDGSMNTDEADYSKTPAASSPAAAPAANNAAPAENASNDYDKVPKTGEGIPASLLLLGIAALCFAGRAALSKKS